MPKTIKFHILSQLWGGGEGRGGGVKGWVLMPKIFFH